MDAFLQSPSLFQNYKITLELEDERLFVTWSIRGRR